MSSPSLKDQALFVRSLLQRTKLIDGATSAETWVVLREAEVAELERIAARLERIAPHEDRIRKLVAGK